MAYWIEITNKPNEFVMELEQQSGDTEKLESKGERFTNSPLLPFSLAPRLSSGCLNPFTCARMASIE